MLRSLAEEHGITGNTYFDEKTGVEDYTESPDLLPAPTLFERAARKGVKSALLSSRPRRSLSFYAAPRSCSRRRNPTPEGSRRLAHAIDLQRGSTTGSWQLPSRPQKPPGHRFVTSTPRITQCIRGLLRRPNRKSIWPAWTSSSGKPCMRPPDAAFLVTADHGMNAKTLCWDLERVCERQGVPLRKLFPWGAIVREAARGCSGGAYVYLKNPQDATGSARLFRGSRESSTSSLAIRRRATTS